MIANTSSVARYRDPERRQKVEEMVRRGRSDTEIVREVSADFGCCENTVRNDLRALWDELADYADAKREHRRNVMRYQLEDLHCRLHDLADAAKAAGDFKAAGNAFATCERIFGRLIQLDGLAESDRVKLEILRAKLLVDVTPAELDAMVRDEMEKLIESMPIDELARRLAQRSDAAALAATTEATASAPEGH